MPDTLRNTQTFLVPSIGRDNGSEHWRLDSEETMRLGVFVCVCVLFFSFKLERCIYLLFNLRKNMVLN